MKLRALLVSLALLLVLPCFSYAAGPATTWDGTGVVLWGRDAGGNLRPITTIIDAAGNTAIVTAVTLNPGAAPLPVSVVSGVNITISASALPTGAGTAANQTTIITALQGLTISASALPTGAGTAANQTTIITALQGLTIASSALPTGASTAANQTTIITATQSIQGALTQTAGLPTNVSQVGGTNVYANIGSTAVGGKLPVMLFGSNGQTANAGRPSDSPAINTTEGLQVWSATTGMVGGANNEQPITAFIDAAGSTRLAVNLPPAYQGVSVTAWPAAYNSVSVAAWNATQFVGVSLQASSVALAVSVTAFSPTVSMNCLNCAGASTGYTGVSLEASAIAVPVSIVAGAAGLTVTATQSGTWNISNVAGTVSLPTGASTAANQASILAAFSNVTVNTHAVTQSGGPWTVTVPAGVTVNNLGSLTITSGTITANQGGTWNINNISGTISLPTGAATSALQTSENSTLSSILGAFSNVTVNTHAVTQSGTWTVQQGGAPWSVTVPAGLNVNNLGSVTITSGTVTANQGGTWNISNVAGTVSLPTGASTAALQSSILSAFQNVTVNTHAVTVVGVPTVNVAQFAGNNMSLGQQAAAASMPVVLPLSQTMASAGNVSLNAGAQVVGWLGGITSTVNTNDTVSSWTATQFVGVSVTTAPTLTKGTQSAVGFSTQDLKDSGRVNMVFYGTNQTAAATATEAMLSISRSAGTTAGAAPTANSYVITSGKTLRITSLTVATRGNATATIQTTTFSLRCNTAGAVVATSGVLLQARSATPATASAWDRFQVPIPDGMEIQGNGTIQIGLSANSTYTTNAPTWDVIMTAFEY